MALFPTPVEIAAQPPPSRDRAIDVIRIVSLVAVVFGHTIMAVSTIRDGVFVWGNMLESLPTFGALTWVLQIMPLFFFAGAAACVESWRPGRSWGAWLMARCTRLYRPVFFYLAFWGVTLAVLRFVLPKHVYEPVAGTSIQLLWFLGAYVLVLAAVPLLYRITTPRDWSPALPPSSSHRHDRRSAPQHRGAPLRTLENNPLPGWDRGFVAGPGVRSAAVGTLLCIAGTATLVSVRWGLKDDGLICVAVLVVALIAARALATDSKVPVAHAVPG